MVFISTLRSRRFLNHAIVKLISLPVDWACSWVVGREAIPRDVEDALVHLPAW
jgi:hypothetical protein